MYQETLIPSPVNAPTVLIPSPQISGTMAGNPPGDYEFAVTFVDYMGRHTAMSPPVREVLDRHWTVISMPPAIHTFHEAVCYCLWWRKNGWPTDKWRPLGGQQYCEVPYLPFTGFTNHYMRGHMVWRASELDTYDSPQWQKGAKLSDGSEMVAPSAPVLWFNYPPKQGLLARWRWLIGNGVSAVTHASPVCEIPPAPQDERYQIMLGLHDAPVNGCIARVLELRDPAKGDQWYYCGTFPLHTNLVNIHHYESICEDLVGFSQSEVALLHTLQHSINRSIDRNLAFSDAVITDDKVELYSPLINPYSKANFGRTIGKANGGRWELIAKHTGPAFMECNQDTRLVGAHIKSASATSGIDFCDTTPQGGGAFAFRTERVSIELINPGSGEYQDAYGIGVMAESGSVERGHTSSEAVYDDTAIVAKHLIIIEGKQSVNWLFRLLDLWGGYQGATSAIVLNNNNDVRVLDKMNVDGVRALMSIPGGRAAVLEGVYTDQGIPQWIVTGNKNTPYVRIDWTSGQNQIGKKQGLMQGVAVDVTAPAGFTFTRYEPSGTENNDLPKYSFPVCDEDGFVNGRTDLIEEGITLP